ncbi:MAG: rhomboid family intramembrane serine protease [Anaerolineae bacterium]
MLNKLHQGRTAARVGDLAEARRLLAEAVQEAPDNLEVWLELAGVAESLAEKKACLEKVLALAPEHAPAQASLALLARKLETTADHHPLTANTTTISPDPPPPAVNGLPAAVEEALCCYRHPQVETSLHCNRCNKPICAKCAQRTPVGFRCPDCMLEIEGRYYSQAKGSYILPYERPAAKPFFTYVFLGAIALVFVAQEAAGGSTNGEVLIKFGANYGPGLLQGELWRLFTSMFLHIGAQHLVFNSIGLLAFGFEMERLYGRWRYLVIYLLAGLFGSLASFVMHGWYTYSAGASGAIFGLVGIQAAFFVFYRRRLGEFGRQNRNMAFVLIGISLVLGFSGIMPSDNWAHLGGFISGFILGYLLAPRYWVDSAAASPRIVDKGSLAQRWWAPTLGVVTLVSGVWLALSYWSGGWWQGNIPTQQTNSPGGGTIEYGQTVPGELVHTDGDIWTFSGQKDQIVIITVKSNDFDPYVGLYTHEDDFLGEQGSGAEQQAQLKEVLPTSGAYTIYVFSGDDQRGKYELNLTLAGQLK